MNAYIQGRAKGMEKNHIMIETCRLILRPFREFVSCVKDADGNPIYENANQYAVLKKGWKQDG